MATVPGSGAVILPVFNKQTLGVDSVIVKNGGSGYSSTLPPILVVKHCGQPIRDAILRPIIDDGKIVSVRVVDPGEGYDPLRVNFTPILPNPDSEVPDEAEAQVVLKSDGTVDYIKVLRGGDKQFYEVDTEVVGGEGSGAVVKSVPKTVTGLSILNKGSGYEEPPFLSITGGGGRGARGVADIDPAGIVSPNFTISDPGQFYLQAPYILLVGGGGLGARARATISQGSIDQIILENPGKGYTSSPKVVFARNVKLKRISRNRQAFNSEKFNFSGISRNVGRADTQIFVSSTDGFPGSGVLLLGKELLRYTGKDSNRFTGLTRGINLRYDQRVILDNTQDDPVSGISGYVFNIGDTIVRVVENASNKIAIVYDWDPTTKELFIVFQVDELAFIDAGLPGEKSNVVFDAGIFDSTGTFDLPHVVIDKEDSIIYKLTVPVSFELDKAFEDDDELDGDGNGLPDLINTGTDYEDQINLDGGIASTLYGIEETEGGQNTTLFEVGDTIKDSSVPFKTSTVSDASNLNEGLDHKVQLTVKLDNRNPSNNNGITFIPGETVTGNSSQVQATVVSWDPTNLILVLKDVVAFDTGNPTIGSLHKFSDTGTVVDVRILSRGNNFATAPNVVFQTNGVISAVATSVLLADQVDNVVISNGGYGYETPPTVSFTGGGGTGVVAQAILGGEKLIGQNGASWRILNISYDTQFRNDVN